MKNIETLREMLNANREEYFKTARAATEAVATLESIYAETITGTPDETVARFVEAVGYDVAAETIATLINRHGWDGRISHRVKAWAETVEGAYDEAAAEKLWIYTNRIHMAHLDQIADAMMKCNPAETKVKGKE